MYKTLFISPFLVDGHLKFYLFLVLVNYATVNICVQVFVWLYVVLLLSMYLGGAVISRMVTLDLALWETGKPFSKWVAPFYILTRNVWAFQFHHILSNILLSLFLVIAILVGIKCQKKWWNYFGGSRKERVRDLKKRKRKKK